MTEHTGKAWEQILSVVYPRRCPVCFEIVMPKPARICPGCRGKLHYVGEPRCAKCGKALLRQEEEYCYDCKHHSRDFEKGISLFSYDSVSRALLAMKYHDHREFADFFGEELVRVYGRQINLWQPEALVPVPLHWLRKLGRGYNQAELLAKRIGDLTDIPVRTDLLKRVRYTSPQRKLGSSRRMENLTRAFQGDMGRKPMERVLLVDDIYTTGSTAQACTLALLRAGIKKVYVISVASGNNGS